MVQNNPTVFGFFLLSVKWYKKIRQFINTFLLSVKWYKNFEVFFTVGKVAFFVVGKIAFFIFSQILRVHFTDSKKIKIVGKLVHFYCR